MSNLAPTPVIPFARGRIEELLAKIFAVCAAVLSIDVFRNGFDQLPLLNQVWFYSFCVALTISLIGGLASAFWFGHMKIWYRAIVFITLIAMITWPLQVIDTAALPVGYKPYIWWAVGISTLAAAGAFRNSIAIVFLILMPITWFVIRTSPFGAPESAAMAVEDSLYSFFFSGSVAILVMFLRNRAIQVDSEFATLSRTRLERAFLDVVQLERTKINSIVHGSVVYALDTAVEASSDSQRAEAAELAKDAIGRLNRESARDPVAGNNISSQAYFESMKDALARRSEFVNVKIKASVDIDVPFEIAVGIAEATFQALTNSLEHAPGASSRKIVMSSTSTSIKFLIVDNGPGFRMSSVPRSRLGIRVAIFERLKSLGVDAKLASAPGEGTTWIFEWHRA
jgi:two-component sensor histidine kinase